MGTELGELVAGDAIESGRVAIRCQYYGPTDHRNARVVVARMDCERSADPNRITVTWDHGVNPSENYRVAVAEYVRRAGWYGSWSVGGTIDGAVAVFVPGTDRTVTR
jgi:hypothetical protein